MVPAHERFAHLGLAFREKSGEKERALYLRARDRQIVLHPAQFYSVDFYRRGFIRSLGDDVRTHLAQRLNHSIHRARGKGGATDQDAIEILPGQQSGEQPHRCRRVSAIDLAGRRGEQPFFSMDEEHVRLRVLDLDPESAHGLHGAQAIVAREEAAQHANAVSQRAQNDRAMGNALVTRHGDFGFDARGAFDAKFHVILIIQLGSGLPARGKITTGDAQHRDNSQACPARLLW